MVSFEKEMTLNITSNRKFNSVICHPAGLQIMRNFSLPDDIFICLFLRSRRFD